MCCTCNSAKTGELRIEKSIGNHGPQPDATKTLLKSKKLDLNKKESWREEIIWLMSPFVTCQHPKGFRWLTSRRKPQGRQIWLSTFFRGSKSIKNRYRFCTIWLVGLEEEIIDKDFRQSYWLALQFWLQPNRIFTVGVLQASHGTSRHTNECSNILLSFWFQSWFKRNLFTVVLPAWCLTKAAIGKYIQLKQVFFQ